MSNLVKDVAKFQKKFGLAYSGPPRQLDARTEKFRVQFLQEELDEYKESLHYIANNMGDDAAVAEGLGRALDALIDLVYVAIGNAHMHGFDFEAGWKAVQAANLKKVRALHESDSKRGTTLDVIKPIGWEAPDHTDLMVCHAHRGEK